jgi:hypothetical protein
MVKRTPETEPIWNDHKEVCSAIDWYLLKMKNTDLEIVFLKYIRKHCLKRIKQIKPAAKGGLS